MAGGNNEYDKLADELKIPDPVEPIEGEVKFKSVAELSRYDPPIGCPMKFRTADGQWVGVEPGEWRYANWQTGEVEAINDAGETVQVKVMDPETRLPINLPVQALGVKKKIAYFLSAHGEVVDMKGSDGKGDYEMLFAGRNDYLSWAWPRRAKSKKDEPPGAVVGWEADLCRQALIKAAGHLPTFGDISDVRGRGMWRDDLGKVVYHAGSAILVDGKWCRPGRYGGYIYPARPDIGRPMNHKGIKNVGERVLSALQTWNWQRKHLDPRFALGWLMIAKMGAAVDQRPTIWLTGAGGAGKSYLQKFLRSMQNGGLVASSNITAPGVYQEMGQDCLAVLLDEMESSEDNRRVDGLVELFRISYSGDDLTRGGKDGDSKRYTLRSACLASSISKPSMGSQDDSRMAVLSLRPIEQEQDEAYSIEEAYKFGQMLTKRAIDWCPQMPKVLSMFEKAMRTRKGHSARSIDTFAPLAAGCHVALYDKLPTAAQLEEWADWLDPAQLMEVASQIPTWEQCIRHLLSAVPDIWRNKKTFMSIGRILREYMRTGNKMDVDNRLSGTRVCVIVPKAFAGKVNSQLEARLFIPNSDSLLVDIFSGSAWKGAVGSAGPWNGVLRQAPEFLWQNDTSNKGGLGSERGVSFQIAELMVSLGQSPTDIEKEDDELGAHEDDNPGEAFGL